MRGTTIAVIGALLSLGVAVADARPRPRSQRFTANKSFGLGIMVGAPSGLSGKYYLSANTALDFGVGAYYRYRDRDGLHVHADFLWHPAVVAKARPFWVPIYIGLGGRFLDHGNHSHVGIRAPVGIMLDFQRTPLDIFLEFALVADVGVDDDNLDFHGALGVRYYF